MKEDSELKKQIDKIVRRYETGQIGFRMALEESYNLGHPTPPVQAKTAEEIAMEGKQPFEMFPDLAEDIQYAACNWKVDMSTWSSLLGQINKVALIAYHAQFTSSAKSVEVEEANQSAQDQAIINVDNMPNIHKHIPEKAYIFGFIDAANWQQQKQADTISRLSGDMEWIAKFCNDPACKRLAKEALKEK